MKGLWKGIVIGLAITVSVIYALGIIAEILK